jgi:TatD DNase family protein
MLVDSHCHMDFPELADNVDSVLQLMRENEVESALCVSVTLEDFPRVRRLAETYSHIHGSVGVHPDYEGVAAVSIAELVTLAQHPRIVAIGETGLDYYRLKGDLEWQRDRFRTHIRAARECGKPLIVHTRNAAADTLRVMREEGAAEVGGVMHCFTETLEVAQAAMDLGFYISFSGIVTFKNAKDIKAVAREVPLASTLVETDSPYLAPVPYRGKLNQPGYVRHVAEEVARLKDLEYAELCRVTTNNYYKLFNIIR